MAYGRTVLGTIGSTIQLSADGEPVAKVAGVTIDWATVAAVAGTDVTVQDGVIAKVGQKYLRYGQLLTLITASGLYGPYDPAAADGRQTLARGNAFWVNRTVVNDDPYSDYPEVIEGGRVWRARLIQSEAAAASLAAGPTFANVVATFPRFSFVS